LRISLVPRLIVVAAAVAVGIFGEARSDDKLDLADPKHISAGRQVFLEKHCSHCHGANGDGGVTLTNRDLSNPNYIFEAIADGQQRGSLRMPAWRDVLSDAEIWQVTAYVMSLRAVSK
jgi:mono/diheme cytochrome c family protein